ncbi:MAG TPA: bifunctional DNA-formamidopyrimidine glycosylase/DNA-(apurinic or apyrimidinic site) lyase [Bryobacteraceae bacterium]|nr:bifunctional DNA-formamidopyrimidine glycosylase/DNA-(apurinic or apyrimidinic site) lyase [Bryobacteraceae bacterium]
MPELPEVEAVCSRLRRTALGAEIAVARIFRASVTRPQLVKTVKRRASGRTIESIRRRGKNILIDLSGGEVLHVHLRMTGDLAVIPDARFRAATVRAAFEFSDGRALVFNDPRALGKIWAGEERLGEIGLEPLEKSFTTDAFDALMRASKQPVKLFLLDQRHVAGIGNIYAAEALFRACIDPRRLARSIARAHRKALHAAIIEVLQEAVAESECVYNAPGDEFPSAVYGREGEPCPRCHTSIRRIPQGGRSTYFCPRCQR